MGATAALSHYHSLLKVPDYHRLEGNLPEKRVATCSTTTQEEGASGTPLPSDSRTPQKFEDFYFKLRREFGVDCLI